MFSRHLLFLHPGGYFLFPRPSTFIFARAKDVNLRKKTGNSIPLLIILHQKRALKRKFLKRKVLTKMKLRGLENSIISLLLSEFSTRITSFSLQSTPIISKDLIYKMKLENSILD
jgi:hypothetical protein